MLLKRNMLSCLSWNNSAFRNLDEIKKDTKKFTKINDYDDYGSLNDYRL